MSQTTVRWEKLWPLAVLSVIVLSLSGWGRYAAEQDRPGRYVVVNGYGSWEERPSCHVRTPMPRICTAGVNGDGCIYGIFIGMTENSANYRIEGADELARNLKLAFTERHLMREEDGIVLTSQTATRSTVVNAFRTLRNRMQPNDVFVFYYGGHGGIDTLYFWESQFSKRDLTAHLNVLPANQRLVVLNACYSGSFARVAEVEEPRIATGIFSSNSREYSYGVNIGEDFRRSVWSLSLNGEVTGAALANSILTQGPHPTVLAYQHVLVVGNQDAVIWRAGPYQEPHDARLCRRH